MRNFFRTRIDGKRCVYCGDPCQSEEHWPPASYGNLGYVLPCCLECNSFAGTEWPTDFLKRCRHVKDKLEKKYYKLAHLPEWSDDELDEIGYGIREGILQCRGESRRAKRRVAWNAMVYLQSIAPDRNFVSRFAEEDISEAESRRNLQSSIVSSVQQEERNFRAAREKDLRDQWWRTRDERIWEKLKSGDIW